MLGWFWFGCGFNWFSELRWCLRSLSRGFTVHKQVRTSDWVRFFYVWRRLVFYAPARSVWSQNGTTTFFPVTIGGNPGRKLLWFVFYSPLPFRNQSPQWTPHANSNMSRKLRHSLAKSVTHPSRTDFGIISQHRFPRLLVLTVRPELGWDFLL